MQSYTVRSNVVAIANASFSSAEVGVVGSFLSSIATSAASAEWREILPSLTAFQRMLPNSGQNRSGTRNRVWPLAYSSSSRNASFVSVSWAGGRNHFAATLASSTQVVNAAGPRVAFLPRSANDPMSPNPWRAVFAPAAGVLSGELVLLQWERSPLAV